MCFCQTLPWGHQYWWPTTGSTPIKYLSDNLLWIYHPPPWCLSQSHWMEIQGQHLPNQLHIQWYVTDTPHSPKLGLPSSSKLRIVQYSWTVLSSLPTDTGLPHQQGNLSQNEHRISMTWHTSRRHSTHHRSTMIHGTNCHHYLPSTHEMTSSKHILTTMKALASSLEPTTSL